MIELEKISSLKKSDIEIVDPEQAAEAIKDREDALIEQTNRLIQAPTQRNFERLDEDLNKQEILAIPAVSFVPEDNADRVFDDNQVFPKIDTMMFAPVNLPHLFTVTEINYHVFSDDASENITLSFQRIKDDGTLEQIGDTVISPFSASDVIINSKIIGSHVVNNNIGSYFIKADFSRKNFSNLKIKKVIILHHR